jgi:hypothetical protein
VAPPEDLTRPPGGRGRHRQPAEQDGHRTAEPVAPASPDVGDDIWPARQSADDIWPVARSEDEIWPGGPAPSRVREPADDIRPARTVRDRPDSLRPVRQVRAATDSADRPAARKNASDRMGPDGPGGEPATARAGWLERVLAIRGWPIGIILAVQTVLSLRLVWSGKSAFIDEALYLSVGHLELAHYLHHAAMPEVASYMSGSPLVYPPLAAVADEIGGLAGARLLSLAFILLATFLLHGVARRLMSSRSAAFFAAAQFLSAFATYDAMALALLALATWLGVRAAEERPAVRYTLICLGGVAILVADAAKYAAALFNPVVIVVVGLASWRAHGRKAGLDACGAMILAAAVPLAVGYDLAGVSFAQGISSTTLARASGAASLGAIVSLSAQASLVVAVLAVLGGVFLTVRRVPRPALVMVWVLVAAEFLAPAEQARIHTTTSLFKHVGYGAWFASIIAGYLLSEWSVAISRKIAARRARPGGRAVAAGAPSWALAMGLAVVVLAGAEGVRVADVQYDGWPNSVPMTVALTRYLQPGGFYLVEEPSAVNYYLRTKIPFEHVDSTFYFSYPDRATGQLLLNDPAYGLAIQQHYFAAIVIRFGVTAAADEVILRDMDAYKDYRLAALIPYRDAYGPGDYQIWVRAVRHKTSDPPRHKKRARRG